MIDAEPIIKLGAVLGRAGTLIMTVPPFGSTAVPPTVKIGLILLLAVAIAPLVAIPAGLTLAGMTSLLVREVAIGLALSMAVRIVVAGSELGGQLAGLQLGFSYMTVVDPSSGARNQVLSTLYGNFVLLALLATDAHHTVLRALAASYQSLPPGAGGVSAQLLTASSRMLGLVLVLGAQLAAPFIVALFVIELALSIVSRSVRGLNMMTIGFALRLVVGLLVLAAALDVAAPLARTALRQALDLSQQAARAFR